MCSTLWRNDGPDSSNQYAGVKRAVEVDEAASVRCGVLVLLLTVSIPLLAAETNSGELVPFDIPQQRADLSLTRFAEQADLTFIFPYEKTRDKTANRLVGRYSIDEAVSKLLEGTGLYPLFSDEGVLTIDTDDRSVTGDDQMKVRKTTGLVAILTAIFGNTGASGQDATEAQEQTQPLVLEEVVVTAQKREQSLQEVPISISVVDGVKILEQGFSRLSDLSQFIPNFNVNEGLPASTVSVRGFNTSNRNSAAFEQAVAVFIDDVYYGRVTQSLTELLDIDRVEVLRGPQTTFFGQSAIAGALNITTRKPSLEEWEGYIDAAYGSDADARLQIAYGGPVTDTFGIRFAGSIRDYDGWLTNTNGEDGLGQESWTGRVTALWAPSERLDVTFKYETSEVDRVAGGNDIFICDSPDPTYNCNILRTFEPGVTYALDDSASWGGEFSVGGLPINFFGRTAFGPFPIIGVDLTPLWDAGFVNNVRASELDNQLITINYDVNDYTFSFTGARTHSEDDAWLDTDMSALFLHQNNTVSDDTTESFEFRVTSPDDRILEWLTGVYLQDAEVFNSVVAFQGWNVQMGPTPPTLGMGMNMAFRQDAEWFSAFASVTWNVTDAFAIDVGVRYTDVEKDAVTIQDNFAVDPSTPTDPITNVIPGGTVVGTNWNFGNVQDSDVDYSLTARWSASETTNFYAKYTDGFKAGGFSANWIGDPGLYSFGPESVDAIEFGAKSSFLDRRLEFNIAVFDTSYDDLQVVSFFFDASGNGVFPIINAAEATSQGIEVDGRFIVNDNFTLGFSGAVLDAEFDSFPGAGCESTDVLFGLNGCTAPGDTQDLSGEPLLYSPDWTFAFDGTYTRLVGNNLRLTFNADVVFADCYECNGRATPLLDDSGYELLNLRIAIGSMDRKWEVSAYGRNVTDTQQRRQLGSAFYGGRDSIWALGTRGANYGVQYRYNLRP